MKKMIKYTEIVSNVLKEEGLEVSYKHGKNPEITGSKYSGVFQFKNPMKFGLIGYSIYLRAFDRGDNLYVHDLLTISKVKDKGIEKVILMNEKIAKGFECTSITVEGGDTETKEIYEKKGYVFDEGNYIGVKGI